jgi:hypothetical protein
MSITNYIQQHFWIKEPIPFFKSIDNENAKNIMLISCFNYNNFVNFKMLNDKKWVYYSGERFFSEKNADIIISFIPDSQQITEFVEDNNKFSRNQKDICINEVDLTNTKYTYYMPYKRISINELYNERIKKGKQLFIQLRDQEREHIEYILQKRGIKSLTKELITELNLYTQLQSRWNKYYDSYNTGNNNKISNNTNNSITNNILKNKPKFCCFIVSNSKCWERNKMFDLLRIICGKKVDSLGKWKRNVDIIIPERSNREEYLKLISQYRFMITFENHSLHWYNTEKIYNAFSAGTIPIYWGDPLIEELYNPKCFINIPKIANKQEQVKELIVGCNRIKSLEYDLSIGGNKYISMFNEQLMVNAVKTDYQLRNNLNTIYDTFH